MPTKIKTTQDLSKVTHWKAGDGMNLSPSQLLPGDDAQGFIIDKIVVVSRGPKDFSICYFDRQGRNRGEQQVRLAEPLPA